MIIPLINESYQDLLKIFKIIDYSYRIKTSVNDKS